MVDLIPAFSLPVALTEMTHLKGAGNLAVQENEFLSWKQRHLSLALHFWVTW